jgi:predicted ArsR family transcriptional regulator
MAQKGNSAAAQVQLLTELLKVVRSQPQTRGQIAEALDVHADTISLWAGELVANGLLVEVEGHLQAGQRGSPAARYRLSPEWGGKT